MIIGHGAPSSIPKHSIGNCLLAKSSAQDWNWKGENKGQQSIGHLHLERKRCLNKEATCIEVAAICQYVF
jgi:hypothetical protein